MSFDYLKEHIKFETEKFRLYFILFLTDISGSVALFSKGNMNTNLLNLLLFIIGIIIAFSLLMIMLNSDNEINKLINDLKQKEETQNVL